MRNRTTHGAGGSVIEVDARLDGEYLVDAVHAQDDVRFAQRAVTVHQAEEWPNGTYCRNDRAPFPCRLHRWGHRVPVAAGWSDSAIAELHSTGAPGDRSTATDVRHAE